MLKLFRAAGLWHYSTITNKWCPEENSYQQPRPCLNQPLSYSTGMLHMPLHIQFDFIRLWFGKLEGLLLQSKQINILSPCKLSIHWYILYYMDEGYISDPEDVYGFSCMIAGSYFSSFWSFWRLWLECQSMHNVKALFRSWHKALYWWHISTNSHTMYFITDP